MFSHSFYAALVQFGGTSPCQGEGYGFEPRMLLHSKYSLGGYQTLFDKDRSSQSGTYHKFR